MAAEQQNGDGERADRDHMEISGMDDDLLYGGDQKSAAEPFGISGHRRSKWILALCKDYAAFDLTHHPLSDYHVHYQFPAGL